MECRIEQVPAVSAIYYALLQTGYEFFSIERDADHIRRIRNWIETGTVPPFFREIRQNTCEAYPYWPRAFILEAAAFFMDDRPDGFAGFDAFRNRILSAANISPEEKGAPLWDWMSGFPAALRAVMDSGTFARYMDWEREWISRQNERYRDELRMLDRILADCRDLYHPLYERIRIILNPVKCVYASDYHTSGDSFVFTSGDMRISSVVHEYLHTVVHPLLADGIVAAEAKQYPGIDASYYLDGSRQGFQNAFEEYAVRMLTETVMREEAPADLAAYLECLS